MTRMVLTSRVLDPQPVASLDDYVKAGGGKGLETARALTPAALVEMVRQSGIRGRGGAGFPTAIKWTTVAANASEEEPAAVVVNAAEGEPGSFKDRELLRRTPYRTLEGALISAHAVGATKVVIGMKRTSPAVIARVEAAIDELRAAGWLGAVATAVHEGPPEYLLGEETALLEVLDGRLPFPRVAPPYRRGVDEVVEHVDDVGTGSGLSAHVEMAGPGHETPVPPTAVDNVETLAHIALMCAHGVDWFRSVGTDTSPGTFVATVSGATNQSGVGEFAMGTPLREVLETLGGGLPAGREIRAVLQGVSSAVITPDLLDTPCTWEDMAAAGTGLGSSSFIVFDDATSPVAIAAAASRFLAVESCGQCTPCKSDGLAISDALGRICRAEAEPRDVATVRSCIETVADSARCTLATQHHDVVSSILDAFPDALDTHAHNQAPAEELAHVSPIHDLSNGQVTLDPDQPHKQPDWTIGDRWTGKWPAEKLDEHRKPEEL